MAIAMEITEIAVTLRGAGNGEPKLGDATFSDGMYVEWCRCMGTGGLLLSARRSDGCGGRQRYRLRSPRRAAAIEARIS